VNGRRATRATLVALVATSGVAFSPRVARAEPSSDNRAAAQVLFDRGRELVESNRSADACPQFAESERLDPGIGTLLWLGDCYENTGQTASAWTTFSEAAATAAQRHDPREAVARARASKLETTLSRLTIAVSPEAAAAPGLQIHCDGVLVSPGSWGRPIPLDPGSHTITANAIDRRFWWTTAQLALGSAGASVTVPALLPEAPAASSPPAPGHDAALEAAAPEPSRADHRGRTQRVVAAAVAAGGATAIVVGSFFSLKAKARYDDSNEGGACLPDNECTPAGLQERQSASSMAAVATIAMGAGAAALAGAAAIYLSAPKDTSARVALAPSAGGGSVDVRWRW
jgi:hypothetical protein